MEWIQLVLVCAVVTVVQSNDEWRIVNTTQGPVRGYKDPDGGIFAFYNIPYATTPTGVNRYKAPLPPPVWLQTYEAVNKDILCPQVVFDHTSLPQNAIMQENCLITNIYVPDTDDRNLPVLVIIHGGAFQIGFGDSLTPKNLVKTGNVIAVTFNYRLGAHGFLCLGTEKAPGNAGLKDQVALLRWVKRNIDSFGGNPNDITLSGHSAGAMSAELLMLSKATEGLFNKVILESGHSIGAITVQMYPLDIARNYALERNFTNVNNLTALEEFYTTSSFELLTTVQVFTDLVSYVDFIPCIERDIGEEIVTGEVPLDIIHKGDYIKMPILYGFANMEGMIQLTFFDNLKIKMNENFSFFLPVDLNFENEEEKEELARSVKRLYFGDQPVSEESLLSYIDYFSDTLFSYPILRAVKYYLETGHNQIYLYEYSFVDDNTPLIPHTNVSGADHCAQTMAVLDGPKPISDEYQTMKEIMREMWSNFIVTGQPVPQGSQLPAWPAVGDDRTPYMSLGKIVELKGLLLQERFQFWEDIYQRYYKAPSPPPNPNSASINQHVTC